MNSYLEIFDRKFSELHMRSCELVRKIPHDKLYWQPREKEALFPINSCSEYILRSAGKIEQTFGGITVKLWDDPFEWTLPEQLSTNELILEYLEEAEATRKRGFEFFRSDEELKKEMPAPVKIKSLFEIFLETLTIAENYQGRAFAVFRLFSDEK
jgi:hypothetical protein